MLHLKGPTQLQWTDGKAGMEPRLWRVEEGVTLLQVFTYRLPLDTQASASHSLPKPCGLPGRCTSPSSSLLQWVPKGEWILLERLTCHGAPSAPESQFLDREKSRAVVNSQSEVGTTPHSPCTVTPQPGQKIHAASTTSDEALLCSSGGLGFTALNASHSPATRGRASQGPEDPRQAGKSSAISPKSTQRVQKTRGWGSLFTNLQRVPRL